MSYRLRFTPRVADDLLRLFAYVAKRDLAAAERARDASANAVRCGLQLVRRC